MGSSAFPKNTIKNSVFALFLTFCFGLRYASVLSSVQGIGRHRSQRRSYSPHRRSHIQTHARKRYVNEPRDHHRSHRHRFPLLFDFLIRNLPIDASSKDLKVSFEWYGSMKDVYLPKEKLLLRFRYGEDAAEAKDNHRSPK
ncbi:serine/arginine-rich SC35-like splicing factor SCL28 [Hibiscus syriacus]|uniref:serine/arginine-rich SC35-like splicing factor SCL28 n=1 Tax=Hibiscus syriacus TaxID=106335 RepID=UPI001921E13D|nr:serine/arginine-rich SC35-like splicing factor SCL28 [Hibiscus syriacus]